MSNYTDYCRTDELIEVCSKHDSDNIWFAKLNLARKSNKRTIPIYLYSC